jgi:uncharacterized protein YajQ (UPF0234 family)
MPSFDIVSEANQVEVRNAVDQANKEITTRFDFKGSDARVEQKEHELTATLMDVMAGKSNRPTRSVRWGTSVLAWSS